MADEKKAKIDALLVLNKGQQGQQDHTDGGDCQCDVCRKEQDPTTPEEHSRLQAIIKQFWKDNP